MKIVFGAALVVALLAIAPASAKGGAGKPPSSKRTQPVATRLRQLVHTPTAVSVRLTRAETGAGINGERITFTFPSQVPEPAPEAEPCTATTEPATPPGDPTNLVAEDGWATCALGVPDAIVAAPSRITATFAGTAAYGPAKMWISGWGCPHDETIDDATGHTDDGGFCVYYT